MNKKLYGKEYIVPQNIIDSINQNLSSASDNDIGIDRAKNLVQSGKVNYNQLKRILHDMKYLDKDKYSKTYNLYGGKIMDDWGWTILNGDRNLIEKKKKSSENINNETGMNGLRKNPHNKTTERKSNYNINLGKSNSEKGFFSSLLPTGLFEEINRIKNLMI